MHGLVKRLGDTNTDTKIFFDNHSEIYDSWYESLYDKLYDRITWDNLKKYIPNNKACNILDAGGGTGYCAIPLAKLGYKIWLVDISENMLIVAKEKAKNKKVLENITFINQDICNLHTFQDDFFDIAICQGDVISYCIDYHKAISELSRVTKVGGKVIVSVAHKLYYVNYLLLRNEIENLEQFLKDGETFWIENNNPVFPIHTFTVDELKEIFLQNNLTPISIIGKLIFPKYILDNLDKEKLDQKKEEILVKLMVEYLQNRYLFANAEHLEIIATKIG